MVTVQRAVRRGNVCKNGQVGNPPAMKIRLGWPFPSNPGLFSNNLQNMGLSEVRGFIKSRGRANSELLRDYVCTKGQA